VPDISAVAPKAHLSPVVNALFSLEACSKAYSAFLPAPHAGDVGSFDGLVFRDSLLTLFCRWLLGRNHLPLDVSPSMSRISPSRVLLSDSGHSAEVHLWHDRISANQITKPVELLSPVM